MLSGCLPARFSQRKLKTNLELTILRLQVANNKTTSTISSTRVAARKEPNERRRRLQCEILVRDQRRSEAMEILVVLCELLVERVKLIEASSKVCPVELRGVISTILYGLEACLESSVEASVVRKQFQAKYGRKFVRAALDNTDGIVDPRIVSKLSFGPASEEEVLVCFEQIELDRQLEANRTSRKEAVPPEKTNEEPTLPPRFHDENEMPVSKPVETTSEVVSPLGESGLSPVLPFRIFRPNPRLEMCFDVRTKNPIYVLERIDRNAVESTNSRSPNFYEEASLPVEYRSRLAHYKHSGYHRGHLAPAADFTETTCPDTFSLCNVSPQVPAMNISIWKKLEIWCRSVARKHQLTLIVTGPLWLPIKKDEQYEYRYPAIDSGDMCVVAVPTHFFKGVAVAKANGVLERVACFVVPNDEPTRTDLDEYKVSWKELEAISGMQFFASNQRPPLNNLSCNE